MLPRPFTQESPFGGLLVKTWKTVPPPTGPTAPPSKATPEFDEATSLNAYSILHDRRIPREVAKLVDNYYLEKLPLTSNNLRIFINEFNRRVETPSILHPINHVNRLFGKGKSIPKINLISVVRLSENLLTKMYNIKESITDSSRYGKLELREMIDKRITPEAKPWEWFDRKAAIGLRKDDYAIESEFNAAFPLFLELLNKARQELDNIQWGAGAWELEMHRRDVGHESQPNLGESWLAPLGMFYAKGERCLVFKFPASAAGFLCRPTHLNAGFYREHFPSPVGDTAAWSGHSMYLANGPDCPDVPLVREFVHPVVNFQPDHLHDVATTQSGSIFEEIPRQRKLHWPRLERAYPSCNLSECLFPAHTGIERCDSTVCDCPTERCSKIA